MKITLCGSMQFEKEFDRWEWELNLAGNLVYSYARGPEKSQIPMALKEQIDMVHLSKIEESNAIIVVNRDQDSKELYVGNSTKQEIRWAILRGKLVVYTSDYIDPVFLIEKWRDEQ